MGLVHFVTGTHRGSPRDYLSRVTAFPKAEAAKVALKYGFDYWDGERKFGYGGYAYDGRWRGAAEKMAKAYHLKKGDRVLDVGCGKGYLLYDLAQAVPGLEVCGVDISEYAIEHAKEEIKPLLSIGSATSLLFEARSFDLVISVNVLHNLYCDELEAALGEIERVSRRSKYVCVESYRSEEEKANLLYWQLTCRMFCAPREWEWWFRKTGYRGDYEFIFFE